MNLARNLIQGAAGGLMAGSVLGLIEALWLFSAGVPDLLAPFYAWVLYGLIGLGLGIAGGVALAVIERFRKFGNGAEAFAFAAGAAAALAPMAAFVLLYVVNKEVYAEQGIPLPGKAAIGAGVLIAVGLLLTVGTAVVRGPLRFLLRGPGVMGAWALMAAITFAASRVAVGDDPWAGLGKTANLPAALKDRPDVLVIAVDTLRADHLGSYGMKGDPTPVLDAFAKDSVVFEQHIAQASWTRSSFASLWSSRIPSSHATDKKASRMSDDVVLLSEALQEGGVRTGNLANNINVSSTFNFDQGYDVFVYESPDYPFMATESVFGLTFYKVVQKLHERIGPKLGMGKEVNTFYQPADVVLKDAKRFIEGSKGSRWFLGVHLMEPHDPYFEHPYLMGKGDAEFNGKGYSRAEHERPDPEDAEYLKQVYVDEIRHMDKKLGIFLEWLKKAGLYDGLTIVLTADHGEEFNEHGGFWHGTTLYDEQIHIPLVIKLPKGDLAGTRVKWQSRAIDVAPTIAQVAGVKAGEGWMGKDLLADVRGELAEAAQKREALVAAEKKVADAQAALAANPTDGVLQEALAVAQAEAATLAPRSGDPCGAYALARHRAAVSEEDFEGNIIASWRDGGFKYIQAQAGGPRGLNEQELFDVVQDPGEKKSLVGSVEKRCEQDVGALPSSMKEKLAAALSGAASGAASGGEAEMDDATRESLCQLGYLSGDDCKK